MAKATDKAYLLKQLKGYDTNVAKKEFAVTFAEKETPNAGYLKTYVVKQGGTADENIIGQIDIPKDFVVKSGSVVTNPEGKEAGKYIALVINTVDGSVDDSTIYINVKDLVDVYTAKADATKVQIAISDTNEISASIVTASIEKADLNKDLSDEITDATDAIEKLNGEATVDGSVAHSISSAVGNLGTKKDGSAYADVKDYVDTVMTEGSVVFETEDIDFDTEW